MKKLYIAILIIVIVLGAWYLIAHHPSTTSYNQNPSTGSTSQPSSPVTPPITNTVSYACFGGKTITAAYSDGPASTTTATGQTPTPTGSVSLMLSDGRTIKMQQTVSADGARYASQDGTIVFWNKGNTVTFTENNQETFSQCIQVATDPGGLTQVYENGTKGFSIRYPAGYTVDEKYTYTNLGPNKSISGVKFTIPAATATGTNLSADSYISIEQIPNPASQCTPANFLSSPSASQTLSENGTDYLVATSSDAAAGNRYDETVYTIPATNPCFAIRYYIHYGAIENYPAGKVTQFDEDALKAQFDQIRKTLLIAQ